MILHLRPRLRLARGTAVHASLRRFHRYGRVVSLREGEVLLLFIGIFNYCFIISCSYFFFLSFSPLCWFDVIIFKLELAVRVRMEVADL